ncbi:uncharacterized protein UDID_19252 [Ustilago sp. UG-2017a]|nr:uncharacterized protein UDID_19252 [Ustilago sp. UG-2017a]
MGGLEEKASIVEGRDKTLGRVSHVRRGSKFSQEEDQAQCHGPECSGSRRAPVESMAVVQSPWRPWTPTDSHAKEERAHMRGGPATKRTKLKEQAQP